jgi:hypothetical protein
MSSIEPQNRSPPSRYNAEIEPWTLSVTEHPKHQDYTLMANQNIEKHWTPQIGLNHFKVI